MSALLGDEQAGLGEACSMLPQGPGWLGGQEHEGHRGQTPWGLRAVLYGFVSEAGAVAEPVSLPSAALASPVDTGLSPGCYASNSGPCKCALKSG